MRLYYLNKEGEQTSIELSDEPLTIGRSNEADVAILDDKASRLHCGIRCWDGDFHVKDLKSKNGTFVNDEKIDICVLSPGDQIRVGVSVFVFKEAVAGPGPNTVVAQMEEEFAEGKGYSTMLREIVRDTSDDLKADDGAEPGAPTLPRESSPVEKESTEAQGATRKKVVRKKLGKMGSKKNVENRTAKSSKPPIKVKIKKKPE